MVNERALGFWAIAVIYCIVRAVMRNDNFAWIGLIVLCMVIPSFWRAYRLKRR